MRMRKLHIFLLLGTGLWFAPNFLSAQNENDVLRYSTYEALGSARFIGMGGAFSTLGGEPSAIMANPAGISQFRRGELSFSMGFTNHTTKASYIGTSSSDNKLNFNIPTVHLILPTIVYDKNGRPQTSGIISYVFGLSINRHATFHGNTYFNGINQRSSITDYFAQVATNEGAEPGFLFVGGIGNMAWETGAIDNLQGTTNYISGYDDNQRNSEQTASVQAKGAINDYQLTGGFNLSNKLLVGMGLFYSSLNYTEEMNFNEVSKVTRSNPDLRYVDFENTFTDKGNSVGAKLGLIFKPNESLRLGASLHTPRTFNINTSYGYGVSTKFDPGHPLPAYTSLITDPLSTFKYKVTTPLRLVTGIGFVINKQAIVTADIDFYNYANMKIRSTDDNFLDVNNRIRRIYRNTQNLRLGLEYVIPDVSKETISYRLRAGFANYPSPYSSSADDNLKKTQNRSVFSGGFGYRERNMYFDAAVSYTTGSSFYTPYTLNSDNYYSAETTRNYTNIVFTLGFNLD